MSHKTLKPLVLAAGAVMIGSLALAGTAFAMTPLSQGYQVAPGEQKAGEEGKCGADNMEAADHAGGKAGEEGKCGEGSCGEDKAKAEGSCGEDKAKAEGSCGEDKGETEGSCGEDKMDGNG